MDDTATLTAKPDGTQIWRDTDGRLHRSAGPAISQPGGLVAWWTHGSRHRMDGPAIIKDNGSWEIWEHGLMIASGTAEDDWHEYYEAIADADDTTKP